MSRDAMLGFAGVTEIKCWYTWWAPIFVSTWTTGSSIHHIMTSASETLCKCSISATRWACSFTTRSRNWSQTEIPFSEIPVRPSFLPSHSNSGSISQNQALICSFMLSQRGCAHTWQILLGLFASTEKMAALPRCPTLHLSTLGF